MGGVWVPEAEARQLFAAAPDGRPTMDSRSPEFVGTAMLAGKQRFGNIQVLAREPEVILEMRSFAESLPK
jgi:hypothetical protein